MKDLFLLLSPRILGFNNKFSEALQGAWKKILIMTLIGIVFWGLMFLISSRVLTYFQAVEVIGDLLAHHLLSMILLTFFSLLIFSHIITALSNLYISTDLELCHSSPVSIEELFLSRVIQTIIDSSWMVLLFGLPVMMAYAYVFRPNLFFYFSLFHTSFALIFIAAGIGIFFVLILVNIFPAQRTKDIILFLIIILVIALYLLFRFLRPEQLVNPDAFFNAMQYISALRSPDSPYLPTHWATEILWSHLGGLEGKWSFFNIALLWSSAIALNIINIWVARAIYFKGFSKSQEAKKRRKGRSILDLFIICLKKPFGPEMASILEKDIRGFFRDNSQWSQLLFLGALVVVYLYNFSVLPLERSAIRIDFLQNEIAFLNMGLAGFVLSSISVRFIFPTVSAEGKAFWIIQSSPMSLKRFLWGKFALYSLPMVVLGETLIIVTNHLLNVTTFIMFLSSITIFLVVFGIVALGIGFGAIYPKFQYENIAQVATGFGGVLYMIFCAFFLVSVIALEAWPVYILFMADIRKVAIDGFQWVLIICSFLLILGINLYVVYKPMKMGFEAITKYE